MKRTLFASLLALSVAAACGATTNSSGASPSASTAARASASATASTSASSAAPSGSGGVSASSTSDPCTLVTQSDAEKVVGTVTDAPSQTAGTLPGVSGSGSVCAYRGAGGLLTVGLATSSTSKSDFDNAAKQVPGVQPISGLGDSAYGTSAGQNGASGATILVLKGSTFFSLSATSTSTSGDPLLNSLKSLAQTAVGKL